MMPSGAPIGKAHPQGPFGSDLHRTNEARASCQGMTKLFRTIKPSRLMSGCDANDAEIGMALLWNQPSLLPR